MMSICWQEPTKMQEKYRNRNFMAGAACDNDFKFTLSVNNTFLHLTQCIIANQTFVCAE